MRPKAGILVPDLAVLMERNCWQPLRARSRCRHRLRCARRSVLANRGNRRLNLTSGAGELCSPHFFFPPRICLEVTTSLLMCCGIRAIGMLGSNSRPAIVNSNSSANSSVHARQPETPLLNLTNNVGSTLQQAHSTSVNLCEPPLSSVVKTRSLQQRTRWFHREKARSG
jgi:hypothetical protein